MYLYSISPVGIQETYIRMSHRDISASVQDLFVRKHILDVRHPNHCSRLVSTLPLFAPLSSYAARLCVAQLLQQLTSIQLSEGNCVNTGDLRSTPPTGHLRCSAHFFSPPQVRKQVCARPSSPITGSPALRTLSESVSWRGLYPPRSENSLFSRHATMA